MSFLAIIDIDNVVIDTDRHKADIFLKISKIVNQEISEIKRRYEEFRTKNGFINMSLFINTLSAGNEEIANNIKESLKALNFQNYLRPGSLKLITSLQKQGEVIFYSEGAPADQLRKLDETGILDLLKNKHVITFEDQNQNIRDYIEGGEKLPGIIIDPNKDSNISLFIDQIRKDYDQIMYIDDKGSIVERLAEKECLTFPIFIDYGKYSTFKPNNKKVRTFKTPLKLSKRLPIFFDPEIKNRQKRK